jgi:myo-inositol-1(or 4)-monophosphatase
VIKKNVIALKDKPTIEFMKGIALKAGKILDAMYGKVDIEYTKENIADVVTKADLASNKLIVDSISKQFPDHTILSEEGDHKITDGHLWIIDPLDGTRNYSTKMPIYGLMIAYAYNKEVEMCVIYLPYFDELYYAQKDKGAFMNDKRIRCSETKNVEHSYGVSGGIFGSENRLIFDGNVTAFAKEKSCNVWINGFVCACVNGSYVSSSRRDWYITWGSKIWDLASVALLMKESGCTITDIYGKPWNIDKSSIVAANPTLHPKLLKLCKGIKS